MCVCVCCAARYVKHAFVHLGISFAFPLFCLSISILSMASGLYSGVCNQYGLDWFPLFVTLSDAYAVVIFCCCRCCCLGGAKTIILLTLCQWPNTPNYEEAEREREKNAAKNIHNMVLVLSKLITYRDQQLVGRIIFLIANREQTVMKMMYLVSFSLTICTVW